MSTISCYGNSQSGHADRAIKLFWNNGFHILIRLLNYMPQIIKSSTIANLVYKCLQFKMIWDIIQESTFDSYFNNESLQIQTLLLDQNIITELKNLNPNLISQYISKLLSFQNNKHEIILKLIQYTTILPTQDQSEDRIHKLPYVSSQVLAIDNPMIYNSFLKQEEKQQGKSYFRLLIGILNTDAVHNEILVGYFEKVMNNLYNCNKVQLAKLVFKNKETFMSHLDKPTVGNIIKNCIIILQSQQGVILLQRRAMVQSLIQKLADSSEEQKSVSGFVLGQIIQKFQTFSSGDELLENILKSQKLLAIFEQKDSNAIDMFLTGYFHKALQKIYSSDNIFKPVMQLPKLHLQKTFQYLRKKKHILIQNFNQTQDNKQFLNQSRRLIKKIDKRIIALLHLIKLAMENKVSKIFQPEDIQNLWNLLEAHLFNDIIKIPIFKIFTLFVQQPSQALQKSVFLSNYHQRAMHLFQIGKQMFGQHLFNLSRLISKKQNTSMSEPMKKNWMVLEQYFKKCEDLALQIQKTVNRYSNRTKVIKLVVDQQDNVEQPKEQIENAEAQAQALKKQQNKNVIEQINADPFNINFGEMIQTKKQQKEGKKKKDPFADFSFFEPQKKQQTSKTKSLDFSDFTAFM